MATSTRTATWPPLIVRVVLRALAACNGVPHSRRSRQADEPARNRATAEHRRHDRDAATAPTGPRVRVTKRRGRGLRVSWTPPPHDEPRDDAEFGPPGYLPQRAANRARKIVLREPMALGWPIAAVVAGLIVLGAGAVFLLRGGAPQEPFVALTELQRLTDGQAAVMPTEEGDVLVVRADGRGTVWRLDGRRVSADGASLRPVPTDVHAGVIYAAVSQPAPAPAPADGDAAPACPSP
ncbi:MAG: hypothetical protein BRC32_06550 [Actinobacteria bacterium QS_8_72_14]|nr:MAG: hypothetical protein BRC32_06550 [Actinobacteria bacterium QS_8_72_14]